MKKYKKIISIISFVLCIAMLVSCGRVSTPTEVIEDSLKKMQDGKENELLKNSIEQVLFNGKVAENKELEHEIIKAYKGLVYEITNEEVDDDKAFVYVNMEVPNMLLLMRESMLNCLIDIDSDYVGENSAMKYDAARKNVSEYMLKAINEVKTRSTNIKFTLSKKEGKWTLDEQENVFTAILGDYFFD